MKSFCLLLLLLILPGGLQALAPHPSLLNIKFRDQLLPVIGLKDGDPVIWQEGKAVRFRHKTEYVIGRTARYANSTIEIKEMKGEQAIGSGFNFTLVASETLQDAYIIIVVYSERFARGLTTYPDIQYLVRPLPELPAGREVALEFVSGNVGGIFSQRGQMPERLFFPIIFTAGGLEVRSNKWEAIAKFFKLKNLVQHFEVLELYQKKYAGQDRPAVPFITIPPLLPDQTVIPADPVEALVSISALGEVTEVELGNSMPPALAAAVKEALGDWFFMPRLKKGEPVASKVRMPITF